MEVLRPHDATAEDMERFHSHEYVDFLKRISPDTEQEFEKQMTRFNVGPYSDCPIFDGLYNFMSSCSGASLDAAIKINHGQADVCVNWSGGLHHAKKGEASGFCYINDIVLCIVELLKYHPRVLYVDIDIHHGDGVEEAFYTTNRVMTCSFHKYGDFFPGSGAYTDTGARAGKNYAVNFPLKDGLDDASFESIFKPVLDGIMKHFQPGAVVMCCGADSISGDRLGCWNMSLRGHGYAVQYVKSFGVPVVLLGGGGYTPRNVARCWAYETGIALGKHEDMQNDIPWNNYHNYFGPNHLLHITPDPQMKNANSRTYMDKYTNIILENLSKLEAVPSVQFQDRPNDFANPDERARIALDNADPDEKDYIQRPQHEAEYYEDEKHQDSDRPNPADGGADSKVKSEKSSGDGAADEAETGSRKPYKKGTECGGLLEIDEAVMEVDSNEAPKETAPASDSAIKTEDAPAAESAASPSDAKA